MKTKTLKYALGTLVMLACWATATHEIRRANAAPKGGDTVPKREGELPKREIQNAPAIQPPAPAREIDPLPLPEKASESEIIGIEFALFEPLPYIAKKSAKRRK
jgi:hypothetical protein